MATKNLGYEIVRNLNESDNDRQALNNLGGGNISEDIELFVNNLRNTSELTWKYNTESSNIENDTKFVFQLSEDFIFTNDDQVMVSGASLGNLSENTMYHIVGYDQKAGTQNNQLGFSLATTKGGTPVSLGSITSNITFTRSDPVHSENVLNVAKPAILSFNADLTGNDFDYDIGDSFNDGFGQVEGNIDNFNFLRAFKYNTNDSTAVDRDIRIAGSAIVEDPALFNDSEADLELDKSPGVYITNPFSSDVLNIEKTRAFSSDANPWVKGTNELTTESTQVNIGDLFFENGIKFADIDDLNTESGDTDTFTHKIPVLIDGVEYFVLLKS